MYDYSNYLSTGAAPPALQSQVPQMDNSQSTGFGTIPNFDHTAAAVSPLPSQAMNAGPLPPQMGYGYGYLPVNASSSQSQKSDDMFDLPAGMYATGNGSAPVQLPSGGALVYGKGGQDPKYIRDSNARNSNDYQLDYALATQGTAQPAPQMQQQGNPGLASQQGYGGMPMQGSNGGLIQGPPMQQPQQSQPPMQQFQQPSQQQFQQPPQQSSQQPAPQSFQQFRQAMQPQQNGQQPPNIAQQLMQQQAMQQAQHQQAQHKGAMVNALLGLGAAGIGMIGGARGAGFAGGVAQALEKRAQLQAQHSAAAGVNGGMTAAGLADLMKAQYEQDPNNPNNVSKYYEMFDKGQGRQIEQTNSAETGRHNLATEGTSAATLAQTTKHEDTQDAQAATNARFAQVQGNYENQVKYAQLQQTAAQAKETGDYQTATLANQAAQQLLQGQANQNTAQYHSGMLGLEGAKLQQAGTQYQQTRKEDRENRIAEQMRDGSTLESKYDYSKLQPVVVPAKTPSFWDQLAGNINQAAATANGAKRKPTIEEVRAYYNAN